MGVGVRVPSSAQVFIMKAIYQRELEEIGRMKGKIQGIIAVFLGLMIFSFVGVQTIHAQQAQLKQLQEIQKKIADVRQKMEAATQAKNLDEYNKYKKMYFVLIAQEKKIIQSSNELMKRQKVKVNAYNTGNKYVKLGRYEEAEIGRAHV